MLMGILYRVDDPVLDAERKHANGITKEYNQTNSEMNDYRRDLIQRLIGQTGEKIQMEAPFYCSYGYQIKVGNNFSASFNLTILDAGKVTIGDNVTIEPNVGIYTTQPPMDVRRRNLGFEWALPVTIGDNVWIVGNSVILPGVTIGNNVTIGAGSVVMEDIPDDVIAAGNPCRIICRTGEKKYGFIDKKDRQQSIQ